MKRSWRPLVLLLAACHTDNIGDKGLPSDTSDTGGPDDIPPDPCWYTGECAPLDICDNGLDDDDNGLVDEKGCSLGFLAGDTEGQHLGRDLSVDPVNAQNWSFGASRAGTAAGILGGAVLDNSGELSVTWGVWNSAFAGYTSSLFSMDEGSVIAYPAWDEGEEWMMEVVLGRVPLAVEGVEPLVLSTWELSPGGSDYWSIQSLDTIVESHTSMMMVGTSNNLALLIDSAEVDGSEDMVGDARAIFTAEPEVLGFGNGVGLLPDGAGDGQTLVLVSAFYSIEADDYRDYSDSFMWAYYSSEAGTVPTDAAVAVVDFGYGEAGGHPRPAGDVDADGYADFLVDMYSGSRMVLFGPLHGEMSAEDMFAFGGNSVSPLGDLDGDGDEDLLAVTDQFEPSVCILYGPLPHAYTTFDEEADACLETDFSSTTYNMRQAVFADVTGDGVGEIVASADWYSVEGIDYIGLIAAFPVP